MVTLWRTFIAPSRSPIPTISFFLVISVGCCSSFLGEQIWTGGQRKVDSKIYVGTHVHKFAICGSYVTFLLLQVKFPNLWFSKVLHIGLPNG